MPNVETGPYEYYLQLLGSWPTGIALVSQWLINIHFDQTNGSLLTNLQQSLNDRETSGWSLDGNVASLLIDGGLQYNNSTMTGCVFARQVSLPGETIEASNQGLDYGGFQAPATANSRSKYEPLGVTMLETNASFLDLVIRPWIIMVGYNGLVARSSNSVRVGQIDVVMYAKAGSEQRLQPRKMYSFYNCAPVAIQGETYSYNEEGLRYSDVKFVYDHYTMNDQQTGNLISLP